MRCLSGSERTSRQMPSSRGRRVLGAGELLGIGRGLRRARAPAMGVHGLARAIENSHERIAAGSRTVS